MLIMHRRKLPPGLIRKGLLLIILCLVLPAAAESGESAAATAGQPGTESAAAPGTEADEAEPGSGDSAGAPGADEAAPAGQPDAAEQATAAEQGLTLQAALEQAESVAWGLQRADAEVDEAAAQVDAARARRLPQVSSTISTTYMTDPPDGVVLQRGSLGSTEAPGTTFPTPVPDQDVVLMPAPESTYYRLGITLEQPLFTWGKLKRGEQAAVLQRSIAAEDRHAASRELRRDTAQAYHGVRFAARMDGLLQDAEDIAGRMLDDQELAYEVGTINLESLLETRAEMQEIRMQRRRAAQALRSAEAGLSMLLHIEVAAEDLVTGYQLHTGNPEEAGLAGEVEQAQYTRAVEISSELQRLRLQLQQAEIGTEVEQLSGMWRPDFSLQVSVEADGQRIPPQANWHDSWNLGVNITLAGRFGMYDGGSQAAAVREAESRQHQLLSGIAELQDGLEYQVRNQREQVANHREEYSLAIVRAELAQERAKNARVSYENELITRTQERGARILQLLAELELERSRYELESSLIELAFLTGRDF